MYRRDVEIRKSCDFFVFNTYHTYGALIRECVLYIIPTPCFFFALHFSRGRTATIEDEFFFFTFYLLYLSQRYRGGGGGGGGLSRRIVYHAVRVYLYAKEKRVERVKCIKGRYVYMHACMYV